MGTGWGPVASARPARAAPPGAPAAGAPRCAPGGRGRGGPRRQRASRPPRRPDRASGRPDRRPRCRCSGTHRGRPRPRAAHGDGDARVASPGGRDPAYRGPRPHGSRGYGRWSGVYCDEHQSTLDPRRAHPSGADPARSVRDRGPGGPTSMTRLLSTGNDPFGARSRFAVGARSLPPYRLPPARGAGARPPPLSRLAGAGGADIGRLPLTIKVLLENLLRNAGDGVVAEADARALAGWRPGAGIDAELPFLPSRVILQDFTGVPAVVDLAAMRDAMAALGGDPARINPLVPADLVIDHSVQVDRYGTGDAFAFNVAREYERNGERYQLLRWAQTAFTDLRVVPPGTGIVHQVNLEYLATVVMARADAAGETVAYPDTLVGTDSHTTMVNGLGVLGYGVGGIEAEAGLLGQPLYPPMPKGVGAGRPRR